MVSGRSESEKNHNVFSVRKVTLYMNVYIIIYNLYIYNIIYIHIYIYTHVYVYVIVYDYVCVVSR